MTANGRPGRPSRARSPTVRDALQLERGDFQTPVGVAERALATLAHVAGGEPPSTILEPTCGVGAFLRAAEARWPSARLHGWDVCVAYLHEARRALLGPATLRQVDVFSLDWSAELRALAEPIWIVGNPPWVTVSKLGVLQGNGGPERQNVDALSGWQARTGSANFDVSEWLLRRWLQALRGRRFAIAVICKSQVARRVMEVCAREGLGVQGKMWPIDARAAFGVAVAAVWLVLTPAEPRGASQSLWPLYRDLADLTPRAWLGLRDGRVVPDADAYDATAGLAAREPVPWRSGVKHDAADVMELERREGKHWTKSGTPVEVEPACVHPLLKGTDLFRGRLEPRRALVLPQRRLGEPTDALRERAPLTWNYLSAHASRLASRRSRIYAGQPAFAVFGVGSYTFAPWKVAVSGLHAEPRFCAVGPHDGRPVVFDDTCYLLPFEDAEQARAAEAFLNGPSAQRFLAARRFADAKRPITQRLLSELALPVG